MNFLAYLINALALAFLCAFVGIALLVISGWEAISRLFWGNP